MARERFTASDVVGLLDCDGDEPVMQGSDDEDILCEGNINNHRLGYYPTAIQQMRLTMLMMKIRE